MRSLVVLAFFLGVVSITGPGCSRSSANSSDRTNQSARQAYIGTWRNVTSGGTMTIEENGDELLVHDENQKVTATVDSKGDVETSIGKISIDKKTGHLEWINGEYERVTSGTTALQ